MRLFIKIITSIYILIFFILFCYGFNYQDNFEFQDNITHLTFETLMAFPDKALNAKNNNSSLYDQTKITPVEFENILHELYKNNYVLVKIEDLCENQNNQYIPKTINVPQNKKPLILSFNNVSYKSSYKNSGTVDKIIIDRNNQLATYTTRKSIQDRVMNNNEFIPILENFIKIHPDFSHNSARGIIFLTGENGILGYETNHKNSTAKHEAKRVSEVITKLKTLGWKFGCNNYKYIQENDISDIEFIKQIELWMKEISPIIGDTKLYAYPYGQPSNEKFKEQTLINHGFEMYFSDSLERSLTLDNNILKMTRIPINGSTLRNNYKELSDLFDCKTVYDHQNRIIPFEQLNL